MSTQIIQLSAGDFDEAMTFLNMVFGEHAPHDFANLLPSIYQPTDEHMRCNYAVRDGGRLSAVVGAFPIRWRVGGTALKMAGIGGVAVHPDCRGKGYMKLLMNHAVEEIRRAGCDLSYLGGRRQRYAYFGYEVAGCKYNLTFNPDNVRHALGGDGEAVTLEPVSGDMDTARELKTLHDRQAIHCDRSVEVFGRYLRSWHYEPALARDKAGRIIGYLSANKEGAHINELVAEDDRAAARIVAAWVTRTGGNLALSMQGPTGDVLRSLGGFAGTTSLAPSGNWRVFNWRPVLDALMRVKHEAEPMPPGSVTLRIEGCETVLRLIVDEKGARCESCDGQPDLTVDHLAAHPLLFGPTSPSMVMPLPPVARMLSAWCPLPLGISPQDKV